MSEEPTRATPPAETPGPSVPAPQSAAESSTEREEAATEQAATAEEQRSRAADDDLVAEEEAAAAAEAARIGGVVPHESGAHGDPAMEPVYQAGGGEAEGFEAAEADLIENASHGDGRGDPLRDAFRPEVESDRSTAVYGEPDQEESTEVADETGAHDATHDDRVDPDGPRPNDRGGR
jgi:hypothetical protein